MVVKSILSVMFTSAIYLAISDAFWNNFPALVTASIAGIILLYGTWKSHQASERAYNALQQGKENKLKLEEVSKNIDGKMTMLLDAKDDVAKAKDEAVRVEEIRKAAKNEGIVETLQQKEKEEALKKIPPPTK